MSSFLGMGSSAPSMAQQDNLEAASRLVDRQLQEDRSYLDLTELLRIPAHNQPSVSGLHDFDYPSLYEAGMGLESLTEVSHIKKVPLPPELIEQFGHMQCNCLMGLFPEIERAWLTIDSDIFIWRFEDGGDLAYFDGLNETILSVALVRPKQGIFQPHIHYLLCLATPVDIVLLGVSFTAPHDGGLVAPWSGEMHLLPEPLFSIPTDNTYIMNITGTDSGRIFMAGKDGCLYELAYQADDGWFSRKCRKINHSTSALSFLVPSFLNFSFSEDDPLVQITVDNSRNILFALSEKGAVQVFDLGNDGKGMNKVASAPLATIVHQASHVARTIEKSNFKPLVHLAAVTKSESANVNLMAVTQTGVRLYFVTNMFGSNKSRPSMLALVHVRLPPGYSATAVPQRPQNVHLSYYSKGTMLLLQTQSEDSDLLWTVGSDSFPFQNQLMESQTTVPIDGKTWALCEVPPLPAPSSHQSADMSNLGKPDPPIVVTQHRHLPRKFVLLNSQGSHIFSKMRPVDQLRHLLMECQGPDSEEVKSFFRLHKVEQACATCLILACSRLAADQQVSDWARMAFFMYGGEARYNLSGSSMPGDRGMVPSNIGPSGIHPDHLQHLSSPSTTVMYSPGIGQTNMAMHTPGPGLQPTQASTPVRQSLYPQLMQPVTSFGQDIIFSGKHNGIYLYMARILRPIWDCYITTDFPCQTPQGMVNYLTSSFDSDELSTLLNEVRDLSDFVDFNSRFDSTPGEGFGMQPGGPFASHMMGPLDEQTRKKLQAEAQKVEKFSLQHVQDLLHRVEEVLGLLKILIDNQFFMLAAALTKDQQNQLRSMTLKQLAISGKDMCGALITSLINRFLDDNATIDAISGRLRDICPSLYSSDDATCSKSNELLQAAKVNLNQMEKRKQLREALGLYKEVSQSIQLTSVCNQFASVQFYEGIVELCLSVANKRDPQKLALHFYKSGEPLEDMVGMQAFLHRMDCYKCITETLSYLLSASVSHPQAPSIPKRSGPPPTPDPGRLTAAEAEQYKALVFDLALKSEDELFHVALYDWLFSANLIEKLLEIQSPFLEPYLQRKASFQNDNVPALDLLWKYYEKTRNFPAAARILSRLSERHGLDIPLQQRIEYLSRAIMCAKSSTHTTTGAEGEFLHELEEKMEVARLQLQVQKELSKLSLSIPNLQDMIIKLDTDLLDITVLYEEFADKFNLSECKLAIVHCAGLYDSALVENLWQNIIDKEINATSTEAVQVRVTNISNKLIPIGKAYIKTERYFPTAFLLKYLEQRSCDVGLDNKWVFLLMLQIGVPPAKLLEIYDRMFKSRDPYWQSVQRPLHLLVVLHGLLNHLALNTMLIPSHERRRFTTVCLDAVAGYLVELHAMSNQDPQVRSLVHQFKSLQARLERA